MLRLTFLGILLLAGQSCAQRTKDIETLAVQRESVRRAVEYLSNANGGIIPLVKKPIK